MAKSSKMSKNKRTERQKQRRNEQPMRTIANKRRKLQKHLRKHPDDQQAQAKVA